MPSMTAVPKNLESGDGPPLASLALALTRQPWSKMSMNENDPRTMATPDLDVLVERVTALLLVRMVAIVATPGAYPDASTTMICTTVIAKKKTAWPPQITPAAVQQLQDFVRRILSGYKEVPYHNREHAYHVIISVNKLLDMMACCYTNMDENDKEAPKKFRPPPSFGLRNDPTAMFALVFAALIHDVEHQGLPNRQLASENDRLAVLYNDQSIAENWSLYIAFSEFLQDEFVDLRQVLFGQDIESAAHAEKYHGFRKMVITLVLGTDLASPERTQVGKSKWKEAFGEPHETVEAKLKQQLRRMSTYSANSHESAGNSSFEPIPQDSSAGGGGGSSFAGNSGHDDSSNAHLSMPRRRWTQDSGVYSEMTTSTLTNSASSSMRGGSTVRTSETSGKGFISDDTAPNRGFASVDEGDFEDSASATPDISANDEEEEGDPSTSIFDSASGFSLQTAPPVVQSDTALRERGAPLSPQRAPPPQPMMKRSGAAMTMTPMPDFSDHQARPSIFSSSSLSISDHLPSQNGGLENGAGGNNNNNKSLNQFLSKSSHSSRTFASRLSRDGGNKGRFRQRLGILRTVDLGGETLETYSRHDRISSSQSTVAFTVTDQELDEPDELKMTVVMETIMAASDIAHNLQSWDHMIVWSRRLYFELRRAHAAGRGADVSPNWFENQIGFLESYVLPLARRLEDTGVWGDETTAPGIMFAQTVENTRDEWIKAGFAFTKELVQQGDQIFSSD